MPALVCDLCGGKLVMNANGIATCDSCGMEYTQDYLKKKILEIQGVVQVDNSNMISSWMNMGSTAAQAGNYEEAYKYFEKVVEVDPENWRAIYEKGRAAAWQSTLANLRIPELTLAVNMALKIIEKSNMSTDEQISLRNEFAVELFSVNNAATDMMTRNLEKIDDKFFDAHREQMLKTYQRYIENISQTENAITLISAFSDDLSQKNLLEFKKRICMDLRSICKSIRYWTNYTKSSFAYFGLELNEKKVYLDKYWKLLCEIRETEPQFAIEKWEYPDPFGPGMHTTREIYNYWEKRKRIDMYWARHQEAKRQYESRLNEIEIELKTLNTRIITYTDKINRVKQEDMKKEKELYEELQMQLSSLYDERREIGIFSIRKDRQIEKLIISLESQRDELRERIERGNPKATETIRKLEAEYQPLLALRDSLNNEKEQINEELTRAR